MVVSIYWIMITSKLISFQILIVICRKYGSIILCVCIFFFFLNDSKSTGCGLLFPNLVKCF